MYVHDWILISMTLPILCCFFVFVLFCFVFTLLFVFVGFLRWLTLIVSFAFGFAAYFQIVEVSVLAPSLVVCLSMVECGSECGHSSSTVHPSLSRKHLCASSS